MSTQAVADVSVGASQAVGRHVLERISTHRLLPGDVLYETSLADELGLSRTPVRSGLTRLVSEGFLEQEAGRRGYRVPRLSAADLRQVFDIREVLESKAAALAAEQARRSDVEELRALNALERRYAAEGRMHEYVAVNDRMHLAIARMGGNGYLERAFGPIYWRSQLYVHFLANVPLPDAEALIASNSPAEHAAVIDAIVARDVAGAAAAAAAHLRATVAWRISVDGERAAQVFGGISKRRRG